MASASSPSAPITSQVSTLEDLRQLVLDDRPWYEALSMSAAQADAIMGKEIAEHKNNVGKDIAWLVAEFAISAADVDALKPVCVAFRALFTAVKGTAKNRDDIVDLINYSIMVVQVVQTTNPVRERSPAIRFALESFFKQVQQIVIFSGRFGGQLQPVGRLRRLHRRLPRIFRHADDADVIATHSLKLKRVIEVLTAGAALQSARDAAEVIQGVGNLKRTTGDGFEDVVMKIHTHGVFVRRGVAFIGATLALAMAIGWKSTSDILGLASVNWHPEQSIKMLTRTLEYNSAVVQAGVVALIIVIALVSSVVWRQLRLTTMLHSLIPRPLPHVAPIPREAGALPSTYIERYSLSTEVVRQLIGGSGDVHALVGIGGCGKTLLAYSIVANDRIREHFRYGIFWIRVGHGGKNYLHALLHGLALRTGTRTTDMSVTFSDLNDIVRHLTLFAKAKRCLLVLDDVWEAEVVRVLRSTGFTLLVTTRNLSTLENTRDKITSVENMNNEEASSLLFKMSGTIGRPSVETREAVGQVARDCALLPLALAVAGSLPIVQDRGSEAILWRKLHDKFVKDKEQMQRAKGETTEQSLGRVLDASFDVLSRRKQEEFLRLAVLAKGAIASGDMLLNLWQTEDLVETHDEAQGLVSRSLLRAVGQGYRIHDLLLDFVRDRINARSLQKAVTLQAQYLGRLPILLEFAMASGMWQQRIYELCALWQSLEAVSGDEGLCERTYDVSLSGLDEGSGEEAYICTHLVGDLLQAQGKLAAADPKLRMYLSMVKMLHGPDDDRVAQAMCDLGLLLMTRGDRARFAEAKSLFKGALDIWLSSESVKAGAVALPYLGRLLSDQAETRAEGEQMLRRAILFQENVSGRMSTGVTRLNLAIALKNQGKIREATAAHKAAHEILVNAYGEEHPLVIKLSNSYAMILTHQGRTADAIPMFQRCVDIGERVLGPGHFDVAVWMDNLAGCLQRAAIERTERDKQSREYEERAEDMLRRALLCRERTFGLTSHEAAGCNARLVVLLLSSGRDDEANALLKRNQDLLQARDQYSAAPEDSRFFVELNVLGNHMMAWGKFSESEKVFRVLLAARPGCALILHNLARVLAKQGKLDEAEELQLQSLSLFNEPAGEVKIWTTGLDTVKMVRGLAIVKFMKAHAADVKETKEGHVREAERLYKETLAMAMRKDKAGALHPSLEDVLIELAEVLMVSGKHEQAVVHSERAYTSRLTRLGETHNDTIAALTSLESIRSRIEQLSSDGGNAENSQSVGDGLHDQQQQQQQQQQRGPTSLVPS